MLRPSVVGMRRSMVIRHNDYPSPPVSKTSPYLSTPCKPYLSAPCTHPYPSSATEKTDAFPPPPYLSALLLYRCRHVNMNPTFPAQPKTDPSPAPPRFQSHLTC
ncbi:unnamed protein product, partial [Laminaria digitata]